MKKDKMQNDLDEMNDACDEIMKTAVLKMHEEKINASIVVVCLLKWAVVVADKYGPSSYKVQFLKEKFDFWLSNIKGEGK